MALMAAPSWAAKGGNSANAALCEPGGYAGVLLAQDGSAFKNAGKCTSYAAKGGQPWDSPRSREQCQEENSRSPALALG